VREALDLFGEYQRTGGQPLLHQASRRLRDRYPQAPTLWAAHIHTGP
jgi:hypothetical protein